MNSAQSYLNSFASHRKLFLVGPLFSGKAKFQEPVLFIDRGVRFQKKAQGISIGDGDSARRKLDVALDPSKNFSDLAYALLQIPAHFTEIHLLGFLGGRRDHEYIGLAEVVRFLKRRKKPTVVYFDQQVRVLSKGSWRLKLRGAFSILTFQNAKLSLSGECEYPFSSKKMFPALSSHGLSNVGRGAVHLTTNQPTVVFISVAF